MNKYEYMIIYSKMGGGGFGRTCVTRTHKIETPQDLVDLDLLIQSNVGFKVMVTDFKLLRMI